MNLTFKRKINAYLGMSKRNILLFFKDKTTIFFSLLAPLIVLFLYIVFLKDTYVSGIKYDLGTLEGIVNSSDIDSLANAWLLAGMLGTSCITVSLNSLSNMVDDKNQNIDYDYNSSPISGPIVVLAYFTGAFINTVIIGFLILTIGLVVLSIIGNIYLTIQSIIYLYLITIIGCASSTIIMMLIVSFFKKSSALGAFSGIVSAAVGFVIGAYVPLGNYSLGVQSVLNLVPGSHIACLYRNVLMNGVLTKINNDIGGLDNGQFVDECKNLFAFKLNMFSSSSTIPFMIIYVVITLLIALLFNIVLYSKSTKRV